MNKQLPLFAELSLALLVILISSAAHILTSKLHANETSVPWKLEPKDGSEIEGYMSFTMKLEGNEHIVHLKKNRDIVSKGFTLFTYSKGELLMEQPHIMNDCYYQGIVEGMKASQIVISTCSGLRGFLQTETSLYEIKSVKRSSFFEYTVHKIEDSDFGTSVCDVKHRDASERLSELNFTSYRSWNILLATRRYIEVYMIMDYEYFLSFGRQNISSTKEDAHTIVNAADSMFDALNTDVIMVGLEIWSEKNLIDIHVSADFTIEDLHRWKVKNLDPRIHCDIAMLILKRGYGVVTGRAWLGQICSKRYSTAFTTFTWNQLSTGLVFAHELGHALNMDHDTTLCGCPQAYCIMEGSTRPTKIFSNCSVDQYAFLIKKGRAECLLNKPILVTEIPVTPATALCGDKVVNATEECDCGSEQECKEDPCCGDKCKLRPGAQCTTGMCCKRCKFLHKGIPCRIPVSECDLAEYCNGTSAMCPPNTYTQDGTPCNNGLSVCYKNMCYDSNRHCRQMFGRGAKGALLDCFTAVNTVGDRYGNCGVLDDKMKKCENDSVKCGRAHCVNVKNINPNDRYTFILQTPIGNSWCWSLDNKLNMNDFDPGKIPDGAKCGTGKICLSGKCVPESNLKYDCDVQKKCSGHGVCNTNKNCHCNNGWAPPDCVQKGYGGSIDSGPLVKGSFISFAYPKEEDGLSTSMKFIIALSVLFGVSISSLTIVACVKRNEVKRRWTIIRERISSATIHVYENVTSRWNRSGNQ
ncbi:disintegrin and metalloproteinase domain-containing protein 9-like [Rhinatrema bivittatum]|uniref:disintegrin and metalloproteinase domain-containing protein 9-like n=1 Tax=Rhinatrema bivittatum TaxID=194408 RepID=UPI00112B065F|nr:disintegrin and metalloproteinase domain-containing protein 9-like [Rhinatrema bivittatum]XP_029459940.1 disintegrin and metalloproteinase domain-containing protein 9-like [Rhinatrema bivittatum]